jgi:hypothetical protein
MTQLPQQPAMAGIERSERALVVCSCQLDELGVVAVVELAHHLFGQ